MPSSIAGVKLTAGASGIVLSAARSSRTFMVVADHEAWGGSVQRPENRLLPGRSAVVRQDAERHGVPQVNAERPDIGHARGCVVREATADELVGDRIDTRGRGPAEGIERTLDTVDPRSAVRQRREDVRACAGQVGEPDRAEVEVRPGALTISTPSIIGT